MKPTHLQTMLRSFIHEVQRLEAEQMCMPSRDWHKSFVFCLFLIKSIHKDLTDVYI